jgi:hypothetical protein
MRGFLGRRRGIISEFMVCLPRLRLPPNAMFRFHIFFHHIDHYRTNAFLWVTSTGIPAAKQALGKGEVGSEARTLLGSDSEDEADGNGGNEEG